MEKLVEVVNRLGSLLEQYDTIETSLAQIEMQREIAFRTVVEGGSRELDTMKGQISQGVKLYLAEKDAGERAIQQISGLSVADLKKRFREIRVLYTRFTELENEIVKVEKTFEILAEANAFDETAGEGGTRAEFELHLNELRKQRDINLQHLTTIVRKCINRTPIVGASDSVLALIQKEHTD